MIVKIRDDSGKMTGTVEYNESQHTIDVKFLDVKHKKEIEKYLHTKRKFKIPESNKMDDFRVDSAYPYDNLTYFELAMCELYTNTGIWVEWGK